MKCPATGKVGFGTAREARRRLDEIRADPRTERIPRKVHDEVCAHCGMWHLTSDDLALPPDLRRVPLADRVPGRRRPKSGHKGKGARK